MLVEDDLTSQKVALLMLKRLGYNADLVKNGLEALQAIEHRRYDLVLMDIVMPEIDGITAAQEIRNRFPMSDQPRIVAVTAYVHPDIRERCLMAGMDDYITKPIRMSELEADLKKYLKEPARIRII